MRFGLFVYAVLFAASAQASEVEVVTDIRPVQSIVANVLGTDPVALFDRGSDPHHAGLKPSQVRNLSQADVLVVIGPTFVPWMVERARAVNPDIVVLALGTESGTGHDWLDTAAVSGWPIKIANVLAQVDPEQASMYFANAKAAGARLTTLDGELADSLAQVGSLHFVTEHDAFREFASRFDLHVEATISDSHAVTPGAAHLNHISEEIAAGHFDCLLRDETESHAHGDMLVDDGQITIVKLDILGASQETGPDLYANLMRAIAHEIEHCLD